MKWFRWIPWIFIAAAIVGVTLVLFQVDVTEYAVVTQFGQPVRAITDAGLYAKLPDPIQSVLRINRQLQVFNLPKTELLTSDKKNIVVEAYATWQVQDPLLFYKSTRDADGAARRLADILAAEFGVAVGQVELAQLATVDAAQIKLANMSQSVRDGAASRTAPYGFTVSDVRVKQLTFPDANLNSVYQRMKAEREAIARQLRSEGTEEAAKIRAKADADRAQILADAQQESEEIRGSADAQSIRIYADAFQKDPEFYRFLRTLESYQTIIDTNTTLILPSDSELLQYLNPSSVGASVPATRTVTIESPAP